MGNQIYRYTLNVIVDEEKIIPIAKGTLQMIDEVTTNYDDKYQLLNAITELLNIKVDASKARVNITYNQNKKTRTIRVLYAKNKAALNVENVSNQFLKNSEDKEFVKSFVKRYCNNGYMSSLSSEVISSINEKNEYLDTLQRIVDLTFNSYKSTRDIYFFMKDYNKKSSKHNEEAAIPKVDANKDLINNLKTLKIIYEYQQLNLFDMIDSHQKFDDYHNDEENIPKIKRR